MNSIMNKKKAVTKKSSGVHRNQAKGLVIVITGNGKGKTTSAFGQALRAIGQGYNVFVLQFMKGRKYGEFIAAEKYLPRLTIRMSGLDSFVCFNFYFFISYFKNKEFIFILLHFFLSLPLVFSVNLNSYIFSFNNWNCEKSPENIAVYSFSSGREFITRYSL